MAENRFAHDAPSPGAANERPDTEDPAGQGSPDRPASHLPPSVATEDSPDGGDGLPDFDPVPLRYRQDGLTPQKQREYVEALADCGVAREAAGRIGVSEQAVNRARRRTDARSFDLACEAAVRIAARRIRSIAFERAIEGTIKRHYYHGELKSEERVYDNRLLVYLLGKIEHLIEPPERSEAVAENWEEWMDAMEQGKRAPDLPDPEADEHEDDVPGAYTPPADPEAPRGDEVWQDDDGIWWTNFPPPAGFDGEEECELKDIFYKRTLTDAERAVMEACEGAVWAEQLALETTRRDRFFGFAGGIRDPEIFSPKGPETSETSGGAQKRPSVRES